MINIISSFGYKTGGRGPGKVFANLTKGLEKLGYPYVVNRDLNSTRRLWIHDSLTALYLLGESRALKVLGPNLFVLPREIPRSISLEGSLYVQPSDWAKKVWEDAGFTGCPIRVWPVGVDTDLFRPAAQKSRATRVLVYHKQRDPEELSRITRSLEILGLPFSVIKYGTYVEDEYRQVLADASLVIWHGCHESQGLALQEAMACDVPILVCDVVRLSDSWPLQQFPTALESVRVTAAPYFDDSCGIKITSLGDFGQAVDRMMDGLGQFAPREYVLKNLSLETQARAFVGLWQHWGLNLEEGLSETATGETKWRAPLLARVRVRVDRQRGSKWARKGAKS
jgi:glycosyltransferase involved in cell wall biosynthesis